MTEVIVTIISGMLSICTILVTSLATSNKKLNNISTTLAVIEEKIRVINHRIGDLENERKTRKTNWCKVDYYIDIYNNI